MSTGIGRTGRAGQSGPRLHPGDRRRGKSVSAIERLIGKPIRRLEIGGWTAPELAPTAEAGPRRPARPRAPAAAQPGAGRASATPSPPAELEPAARRQR